MRWNKGYSATFYAAFVDPVTWRDTERFEITGGSISRSDSDLQESCDLDCIRYDQSRERWVRVWMDIRQDGAAGHYAMFTGLATSPERTHYGVLVETPVEMYSVLKPADDVFLQRGYYAPIGASGANLAKELISVTPAPIETEPDSPLLGNAIIAEDGETRLTMAKKILEAINWRIDISGSGTIRIGPKSNILTATFSPAENDSIEPEISVDHDWFACPNVLRVIFDDMSAVARDDSPDSPLSTVNRGREVWVEEDCDLADGETLAEYAQRRLKELQAVGTELGYDRRYHPDINVGSIIQISYPGQNINGYYEVTNQKIELEAGGRTSEEAKGYDGVVTVPAKGGQDEVMPELDTLITSDDYDLATEGGVDLAIWPSE